MGNVLLLALADDNPPYANDPLLARAEVAVEIVVMLGVVVSRHEDLDVLANDLLGLGMNIRSAAALKKLISPLSSIVMIASGTALIMDSSLVA